MDEINDIGAMETYTGLTANTFKERWNGHISDMRKPENRTNTKLSANNGT